jgi:hypothetical protein
MPVHHDDAVRRTLPGRLGRTHPGARRVVAVVAQNQSLFPLEILAHVVEFLLVESGLEFLRPDPLDLVLRVVSKVGNVVSSMARIRNLVEQGVVLGELPQIYHERPARSFGRGRFVPLRCLHRGCDTLRSRDADGRQTGKFEESSSASFHHGASSGITWQSQQ